MGHRVVAYQHSHQSGNANDPLAEARRPLHCRETGSRNSLSRPRLTHPTDHGRAGPTQQLPGGDA
eukprot:15424808-Alexandrium_andersonii.AAC.1